MSTTVEDLLDNLDLTGLPERCPNAKRYKGRARPRCNQGEGCQACWRKYLTAPDFGEFMSDRQKNAEATRQAKGWQTFTSRVKEYREPVGMDCNWRTEYHVYANGKIVAVCSERDNALLVRDALRNFRRKR